MKKTVFVKLFLLLWLFIGTSFAADMTVFGPSQYVRTQGSPDIYTGTFHGVPGAGTLLLKNGSVDGNNRIADAISSAEVLINGVQIFGPSDFNQKTYSLEAPVTLSENNSITIEMGSNPGSYMTIEVRQAGEPPPTVSISADLETIQVGESSTLTWSSINADSCVIEPGIGSVGVNGSITVSLSETTTYTITAIGPGGTVTASVTVTILYPPTVEIYADPEVILLGESSTLTWIFSYADACVIEPGIGVFAANGSTTVSPTETTTYSITATGAGGTAIASVTVTIRPITISISSPLDGGDVSRLDTMVKGTITNLAGNETGVVVNGIIATVYGNQFVASHVPLEEGQNMLTAAATDTDGNTAQSFITINALPAEHYISIIADDTSGVSGTTAFETTLKIDGSFNFTEYLITDSGPGVVEFLSTSAEACDISITTPGIYYFTAEVTDDQSNTFTDTVAILVLDQTALDALLKAKWEGMRTALISGDIGKALTYHQETMHEKYAAIYNALGSELPVLTQQMAEISPVYVNGVVAKYRIQQDHNIDGQAVTITYYIYFSRDKNGLWLIEKY